MKTTAQPNPNPTSQPDGIEVKINPGRISVYVVVFYLLVMFASSVLYIFIWEEFSVYNLGHYIGQHWGRSSSDCCSSYLSFTSWPAVW